MCDDSNVLFTKDCIVYKTAHTQDIPLNKTIDQASLSS